MDQKNTALIPVTFVNLYTQRRLMKAGLPALPFPGDSIYLKELGYVVAYCEWTVQSDESVDIVIVLRPHVDAKGERVFTYPEE